MARVNVYLPDDLAKRAREAGLNVSRIAQEALEHELGSQALSEWLDRVRELPRSPGLDLAGWQLVDEARAEDDRAWDEHLASRGTTQR